VLGADDIKVVVTDDTFNLFFEKHSITSNITKNTNPHQFNIILGFHS
jgi:hypothetical protein